MKIKLINTLRKITTIIFNVLEIAVFISIILLFLLRIGLFQDYLGKKIISSIGTAWSDQISIGQLSIRDLSHIHLFDAVLNEIDGDTAAYVSELQIKLGDLDFFQNQFVIQNIKLKNATINLFKNEGEEKYNFQLLFKKNQNENNITSNYNVFIENVELINCNFNHHIYDDIYNNQTFDYQYFKLTNLNGLLENFYISNKGLFSPSNRLSFQLDNALEVKDFSCEFNLVNNHLAIENIDVKTLKSELHLASFTYDLKAKDIGDILYLMDSINGNLNLKDVIHFYPVPFFIDTAIQFCTHVEGEKGVFSLKDFVIQTGTKKPLTGNLTYSQNSNNLSLSTVNLELTNGLINKENLSRILIRNRENYTKFILPSNLKKLTNVDIRLFIDGSLKELDSKVSLISNLGQIDGDIIVDATNDLYHGVLKVNNLSGYILNVDEGIDDFDGEFKFKGKGLNSQQVDIQVEGLVNNFNYNGYEYEKIKINGAFLNESFNGFLALEDKYVNATFNGLFDLNQKPTKYNFSMDVKSLNPHALNWTNQFENLTLNFNSNCSGIGLDLNDFVGDVSIEDITVIHQNESVKLNDLSISSVGQGVKKEMHLNSDMLTAEIKGNIDFGKVLEDISYITSAYAPNLIDFNRSPNIKSHHTYDLTIRFNDFDRFSSIFMPGLSISKGSLMELDVNSQDTIFSLFAKSDKTRIGDNVFSDIIIRSDKNKTPNSMLLYADINEYNLSNQFQIQHIQSFFSMHDNRLSTTVMYMGEDSINHGKIELESIIHSSDKIMTYVDQLTLGSKENGIWQMGERAEINFHNNKLNCSHFHLANQLQELKLNGNIGPKESDELNISLSEFDLSNFGDLTNNEESKLQLNGVINLDLRLKSILNNIEFTGSVLVNQLKLNDIQIGDLTFKSDWEGLENRFMIEGGLRNENRVEEINFQSIKYYPFNDAENQLEGAILFQGFNADMLNPFLPQPYLGNLETNMDGAVFLSGSLFNPVFNGELKLNDSKIDLVQHQTSYLVDGTIYVSPNQINLVDAVVTDKYNNKGALSASYDHEGYNKYSYNIISQFDEPFLVMNNSFDDNPLYYGDAYVTGFSTISYDTINDLSLNIHVKTAENSVLTIPLYGDEDVVLEDFITFEQVNQNVNGKQELKPSSDLAFNLNIEVEVTDDAEILVVFDQMVGDVMKSRGNGDVRFFVDETLDFNLFGNYEVTSGEYLFTLKDFINKKFNVKPGGTITWFGDPYNAKLDLNAYYPLKTSLYNIMPSIERDNWTHKSNVNVDIHLQNDLMNPDIEFDISLPKAEESAKQTVKNLIYNEEAKNQQVFSLLILNKFIPENQNIISENTSRTNGATTSEVLSNQLGNMISSFTDEFEIGFNYSPGDSISDDELSIVMSTQQFNDRLLINTNLGVAPSNALNKDPNSFIGDVDVEYKLSRDGNLRLHAFNESNEYDLSNQSQSRYTQGVGAYYKQSFNSFGELFCEITNVFRRKSKKCNQCDEPKSTRECP